MNSSVTHGTIGVYDSCVVWVFLIRRVSHILCDSRIFYRTFLGIPSLLLSNLVYIPVYCPNSQPPGSMIVTSGLMWTSQTMKSISSCKFKLSTELNVTNLFIRLLTIQYTFREIITLNTVTTYNISNVPSNPTFKNKREIRITLLNSIKTISLDRQDISPKKEWNFFWARLLLKKSMWSKTYPLNSHFIIFHRLSGVPLPLPTTFFQKLSRL